MLVVLEVAGKAEPDKIFGASLINAIEPVSSRCRVKETPVNFPVGPIVEVSVTVQEAPGLSVSPSASIKDFRDTDLVVVITVADERFAGDAFERLFERFELRVMEGDPLFVFMINRSIG